MLMAPTPFLVGPNTGPDQAAYLSQLQQAYSQGGGISGMGSAWGGAQGGGGGYVSQQDALSQSYQDAYDQAKAANEARYGDILTGYQDRSNQYQQTAAGNRDDLLNGYDSRYQRGMGLLQGQGLQEKNDILRQYGELASSNQQDMVNRGLTGTTIMPTMRMGIEREQQAALSRVNERLQNQALNVDSSLSGDALSAQERQGQSILNGTAQMQGDTLNFANSRTDSYPNYNQLASLQQGLGAAGGNAMLNAQLAPVFINPNGVGAGIQQPAWNGLPNFQNVRGGNFGGGAFGDQPGGFNMQMNQPQQQQPAPFAQGAFAQSGMPSSGDPQVDATFAKIVAILGHPPQSQEEALWALQQLSGNSYA